MINFFFYTSNEKGKERKGKAMTGFYRARVRRGLSKKNFLKLYTIFSKKADLKDDFERAYIIYGQKGTLDACMDGWDQEAFLSTVAVPKRCVPPRRGGNDDLDDDLDDGRDDDLNDDGEKKNVLFWTSRKDCQTLRQEIDHRTINFKKKNKAKAVLTVVDQLKRQHRAAARTTTTKKMQQPRASSTTPTAFPTTDIRAYVVKKK